MQPVKRQRSLPERLMDDYNRYWFETLHIRKMREDGSHLRPMKATAERLQLFAEMVVWCRGQEIDPRIWLYVLFRSRAWRFAPKLTKGSLETTNAKIHELYQNLGGLDAYRRQTTERSQGRSRFDPNRDVDPTVEQLKMRYLQAGAPMDCMTQMVERTLGYHPGSGVCVHCPAANECAQRLQDFADFDILALRSGRLTSESAMAQVRRVAKARAKIRKAVMIPTVGIGDEDGGAGGGN
jgi:hypothetical protein